MGGVIATWRRRGPRSGVHRDIYNRQRLHSALDYLPPEAFEARLSAEPCLPLAASTAPPTETIRQPSVSNFVSQGWGTVHKWTGPMRDQCEVCQRWHIAPDLICVHLRSSAAKTSCLLCSLNDERQANTPGPLC